MGVSVRLPIGLVLAAVVSIAACGCGGGHQAASKPRPSPTYADPQCPIVLAGIPANPPATQDQAGSLSALFSSDPGGLGRQLQKGSLLQSLVYSVGSDAFNLSFDMGGLTSNTSADLATYNSDVRQLRQYCHG
jgi:hypothetical protein